MTLESHHLLFNTHETRTFLVHQLFYVDRFGLTCSMRPTDGLEFCRRIPRRSSNVDSSRFLEIETLTTTLYLNDEYRSWSSLFETLNLSDALLLGYRTVDSVDRSRDILLNVIHLTSKLTEDEGLFIWVLINHTEEGLHLVGVTHPFLRLCLVLLRDTIEVHLSPNHHLTRTKKAFQDDHIFCIEALCISESYTNRVLCLKEHNLVELLLIWKHFQLNILKVAWRKAKALIDFGQVFLGASKDIDVLDFACHTLNNHLGETQECTEGHKVLHRIEHWGARHNPLDLSLEATHTLEQFGLFVTNLVGFIQNDAVPLHHVKGRLLMSRKEGIRCESDICILNPPLGSIKDTDCQVWGEAGHLFNPLCDNRFGYDDECASFRIPKHSGNNLHSLTQTHFVTKEPTLGSRGLALHSEHPKYTLSLIGCEKPTIEGVLCTVVLLFDRHSKGLLRGVYQSHREVVV